MKNKAFTLIELLVTIAIISLLTSIVFASISSAREKANITTAKVQAKEIEKAVELSRLSNGRLPFSNTDATVNIEDTPLAVSSLEKYYPSINSVELPNTQLFEGVDGSKDYQIIAGTSGKAEVTFEGFEHRTFLATCREEINYNEEDTSSWTADDFIVTYWSSGEPRNSCFITLGGFSDQFQYQNLDTLYIYDDELSNPPKWVPHPLSVYSSEGQCSYQMLRCAR